MEQAPQAEPEVLASAIKAICGKFKKATDIYCREYPGGVRFESAVRAYDFHKRHFNRIAQGWLKVHGELPDWAKETLAYQAERGFLDPLWKTWGVADGSEPKS